MNAHLNWHADEVLEFKLTVYNPLKVELPLTKLELFAENRERLVSLTEIRPLRGQSKEKLSLRFRSTEKRDLVISHLEITIFKRFKTRIELD